MMKNLIFIVFSIALLTQSCSQSDDFIDKQSVFEEEIVEEEIDFPKQVEAYGKAVAKEIEITVAKLNDLNMDYPGFFILFLIQIFVRNFMKIGIMQVLQWQEVVLPERFSQLR